jgi:hypothetical protein
MITHLLFLLFVGIAVYAQSVTGFALSFILLGLIGTINLVPIVDAVNIVSVILVINSIASSCDKLNLDSARNAFTDMACRREIRNSTLIARN